VLSIDPETDKDPAKRFIAAAGTITFCEDLEVDTQDPVLLALALELKSKKLGEWNKEGWVDGWKSLGCVLCLQMLVMLADQI
jgi:DCN1-like protein 1/2